MEKTYWQIAGGSYGRNYEDIFLRYGMAFVGEGDYGNTIKEINEGDIILLKRGLTKIIAAGEVVKRNGKSHNGVGDKSWLNFDGWGLNAYCYVDWHMPEKPKEISGLVRRAIARIKKEHIKESVDEVIEKEDLVKIEEEPNIEDISIVEDNDIIKMLIKEGVKPSEAFNIINNIKEIKVLASYYYENDWNVLEFETRTFLIIPLLITLGWSQLQIKIEKDKNDIMLYSKPYKADENEVKCIIETKKLSEGLDDAANQVIKYAKDYPSCQVLAVSNGHCYKIYIRSKSGDFNHERPSASLNLFNMLDKDIHLPEYIGGALEVLKYLMPIR